MMKTIDNSLLARTPAAPSPSPTAAEKTDGASFMKAVDGAVNQVNRLKTEADEATHRLATGDVKDLHQTMIALEKASVSFRFITEVRNKVIEAYREIMRMQV